MSDNPNLEDTWIDVDDNTQELSTADTPLPGSWDELIERERQRPPELPTEAINWGFERRDALTPEGQPLGVALFVTMDDPVPEFDEPPGRVALEIAHFETPAAVEKFEREFREFLIPGLLEAPELAESVASMEGMSGEWAALDNQSDAALVRESSDWHIYNSLTEREAYNSPTSGMQPTEAPRDHDFGIDL